MVDTVCNISVLPSCKQAQSGNWSMFFTCRENKQRDSTRLCCGDEAQAFFSARDQLDEPDLFALGLLKQKNSNAGTGVERMF